MIEPTFSNENPVNHSALPRHLCWLQQDLAAAFLRLAHQQDQGPNNFGLPGRWLLYGFSLSVPEQAQFASLVSDGEVWSADAPSSQLASVLGEAYDGLIFNAWAGFHPDRLALLSGTIRGGGHLLLISPPADDWTRFDDPEYQRLISTPDESVLQVPTGNYLRYVVDRLQDGVAQGFVDQDLSTLKQKMMGAPISESYPSPQTKPQPKSQLKAQPEPQPKLEPDSAYRPTAEQHLVVQAVLQTLLQSLVAVRHDENTMAPVGLVAGARGRGKSQVLAFVLEQLLRLETGEFYKPVLTVVVIVPHPAAVATLKHYKPLHEQIAKSGNTRGRVQLSIEYCTPTTWLARQTSHAADIMFIEEAAALPFPTLKALIAFSGPVVMATTTIGYEGSGRILAEGFERWLKRTITPQHGAETLNNNESGRPFFRWTLHRPLRWSEYDSLEPLLNQVLLLDDTSYSKARSQQESQKESQKESQTCKNDLRMIWLNQAELAASPETLSHLWALLYGAHYRTRPSDLRALLDQPGVAIVAAYMGNTLVGGAWFVEEGPFSDALSADIMAGRRRPKGHLLPQIFALRFGYTHALHAKHLRCVRIAVAHDFRHQNVGRAMLTSAERKFSTHVATMGASCALQPDTVEFWRKCGYQLLRLGVKPNARSGAVNFAVFKPFEKALCHWATNHDYLFWAHWPHMKKYFSPADAAHLIETFRSQKTSSMAFRYDQLASAELATVMRQRLAAFAIGTAEEADVAGLLASVVRDTSFWQMIASDQYSESVRSAFLARVCDGAPWAVCLRQGCFPNHKQAMILLRRAVKDYLACII